MLNKYLKAEIHDKYEISSGAYDEKNRKLVRGEISLPSLHLVGLYNKNEDNKLFEEISSYRSKTTQTLILRNMMIDQLPKKPQSFPLLEKLIFHGSQIRDANLLRFNEWCPNVRQLVVFMSKFSNDAYNAFISAEYSLVHVKSLAFNFRAGMKLSREFLAAIDKKFPSLENLYLVSVAADFGTTHDPPSEPLYLKNVKFLSVVVSPSTRDSNDVSEIFDFLAISNGKLKGLEFTGKMFPEKLMKWVESCKQLSKLTLFCSKLRERDLNKMNEMPSLAELKLRVESYGWDSAEMFEFSKIHRQLKLIDIQSDRSIKAKDFNLSENTKKQFDKLAKQRGKLMFMVEYLEDGRKVEASESGVKTTKRKPSRNYDHEYDPIGSSGNWI